MPSAGRRPVCFGVRQWPVSRFCLRRADAHHNCWENSFPGRRPWSENLGFYPLPAAETLWLDAQGGTWPRGDRGHPTVLPIAPEQCWQHRDSHPLAPHLPETLQAERAREGTQTVKIPSRFCSRSSLWCTRLPAAFQSLC